MPGGRRGLQNRRGGESSLAGSIPVRLREPIGIGAGAVCLFGLRVTPEQWVVTVVQVVDLVAEFGHDRTALELQ